MDICEFYKDRTDRRETEEMPSPAAFRLQAKLRMQNSLKLKKVEAVLPDLPSDGESLHVVSDGSFDFWLFVPYLVNRIGTADEFYGSTWTMNRNNVIELLDLFDDRKILSVSMMTGTYFKRRETAVYAALVEGLDQRGQRYIAFQNHTKIVLLRNPAWNLVIEGSANFTANPRVEQFVMTNHANLYRFHRDWMEEIFHENKPRRITKDDRQRIHASGNQQIPDQPGGQVQPPETEPGH